MSEWKPPEKETPGQAKCWLCEKHFNKERLNHGLCPKCVAKIDSRRRVLAKEV